jgi:hypothetical protein
MAVGVAVFPAVGPAVDPVLRLAAQALIFGKLLCFDDVSYGCSFRLPETKNCQRFFAVTPDFVPAL